MVWDSFVTSKSHLIVDRYRVERVLGMGGMGDVYLATDTMLGNEQVALKVLKAELCLDPNHTKRFLREVQLTRKVTHPNVVRTFDAGSEDGRLFFTMEYIKGKTLREKLAREPLSPKEACAILIEICRGLTAIHDQEIIHRDLKLSNVILTDDNLVKIADFGVAKPGVSDLTGHDELVGSATHMAPEVWQSGDVSPLTDIYSLGVLTYEMLTGILPFDGSTANEVMWKHINSRPAPPMDIVDEVPEWLNYLVMRMLAKKPGDRPGSAAEITLEIQNKISSSPSIALISDWGEDGPLTGDHPTTDTDVMEESVGRAHETFHSYVSRPLGIEPPLVMSPVFETHVHDRSWSDSVASFFFGVARMLFATLIATIIGFLLVGLANSKLSVIWILAQDGLKGATLYSSLAYPILIYTALATLPILVLSSCGRSLISSVVAALKATIPILALNFIVITVSLMRLFQLSVTTKMGNGPLMFLSSLESAGSLLLNAALLSPTGPIYKATIVKNSPSLIASTDTTSIWIMLPLACSIFYALIISSVIRRSICRKRGVIKLTMTLGVFSVISAALVGENLLAPYLRPLLAQWTSQVYNFMIGPIPHSVDGYSLLFGLLNWILVITCTRFLISREGATPVNQSETSLRN